MKASFALPMTPRPPGLILGHLQEDGSLRPIEGKYYRSGDAVRRSPDGVFTYIGRVDDVFKSSDYRISPFELESVLIEHEAVVEAAVVPSPDHLRLAVPKAFYRHCRGAPTGSRHGAVDLSSHSHAFGTVQASSPDCLRRAAEDHFGQDPSCRIAACRGGET
jgi:acetyl-CoA synthetase